MSSRASDQDVLDPDDPPQYPGDDTRLTSAREITGWYSYGFGAEVFVACGIGSFLPMTLEQLVRDRGVLLTDHSKPCKGSKFDLSPPTSSDARHMSITSRTSSNETGQCIVNFLGIRINTASFALYTFAISVAIQALLIISISAAADHGHSRKKFLLAFALTGAIATMLFLFVVPEVYPLAALLAIVSNACFGASFVLLNSFLPILVRRHPSLRSEKGSELHEALDRNGDDEVEATESEATSTLLRGSSPKTPKKLISPALQLSTRISSYGIGFGYIAAVIVQILGIIIVLIAQPLTNSTTLALRIVLFFIGIWWLAFTIPAALFLRPRPGPPLPYGKDGKRDKRWIGYLIYSWKSLWKTCRRARHLKDMILFLGAWFMLSDAIATISGTAVLFAKTELQMKTAALALMNLIGMTVGVIGAFSWSKISQFFGLKPSQTIVACICLFEIIPLYCLLGFIPAIKRLGFLGLQQPWEMYPLGALYGFVLGGLSSYCRSLFSELIPPGYEAAFYALYAITDKGSSVFGPAITGAITDRFGEIRPAFVFLAVLIIIPLPLMLAVDTERGHAEAQKMAEILEGRDDSQGSDGDNVRLIGDERSTAPPD